MPVKMKNRVKFNQKIGNFLIEFATVFFFSLVTQSRMGF